MFHPRKNLFRKKNWLTRQTVTKQHSELSIFPEDNCHAVAVARPFAAGNL